MYTSYWETVRDTIQRRDRKQSQGARKSIAKLVQSKPGLWDPRIRESRFYGIVVVSPIFVSFILYCIVALLAMSTSCLLLLLLPLLPQPQPQPNLSLKLISEIGGDTPGEKKGSGRNAI